MRSDSSLARIHKALLLARIPASILMGVAILLLAHPTANTWMTGFALIVIGELLRIWASGHIHKSAEVTQTGPYAMVRHPLYLGHFLVACGFCIVSDSLMAFVIVMLAFFVIYAPTWKNEEQNLTKLFGETYSEYMAKTPALLPRLSGRIFSGSFSWALVKQHREWNHVAGLAAGLIGMVILGWWHDSW